MESVVLAKCCGNTEKGAIYWDREIFRKDATEDLAFSTFFFFFLRKDSDNTIFLSPSASEQVTLASGGGIFLQPS